MKRAAAGPSPTFGEKNVPLAGPSPTFERMRYAFRITDYYIML
jgi:hypothetical protein